jgi:hypothetical protein
VLQRRVPSGGGINLKDDLEKTEPTEVKPFNSAIEHYQKIMGMPNKSADLTSMPKPIRRFGYFIMGFVICALLAMIITKIFF